MSKELVQNKLKGDLEAQNVITKYGNGACFTICLPK
jgi:hypothetical protein